MTRGQQRANVQRLSSSRGDGEAARADCFPLPHLDPPVLITREHQLCGGGPCHGACIVYIRERASWLKAGQLPQPYAPLSIVAGHQHAAVLRTETGTRGRGSVGKAGCLARDSRKVKCQHQQPQARTCLQAMHSPAQARTCASGTPHNERMPLKLASRCPCSCTYTDAGTSQARGRCVRKRNTHRKGQQRSISNLAAWAGMPR
jgi:hypothetical protein